MSATIYILNGPNLNRLGAREPEIYGRTTLAEIEAHCREAAGGRPIRFEQSNGEKELIEWIQEATDEEAAGIIINPAGYSFTSVALLDALRMFPRTIIELHISNIHSRDPAHRHSLISQAATAVICGLGATGYRVALRAMIEALEDA